MIFQRSKRLNVV